MPQEAVVTFAISIFDLFCFAVPGALELSIVLYLLFRLDVLDPGQLTSAPSALLVGGFVVAGYLVGRLCHPLGAQLERVLPRWRFGPDAARQEFLARNPQAAGRPFVTADPALLLAAAETHNKEAGAEIGRMRAQSLMLRNTALALAVAAVVALAEVAVGGHRWAAAGCLVLLASGAIGALRGGRVLWHVSRLKTLEISFWIADVDRLLSGDRRPETG